LTLMIGLITQAQESLNMTLLSNLDYNNDLSDIWGYATADGEYALVGVYDGISVVDITDPTTPNEIGFFPGDPSIWRDLKTWGDYLYCINETGGGLQIVNLVEVINGNANPTYIENMSLGFSTAHNIFIDENGVLYVFGSNYGVGGAAMYDLVSNPENPNFLGVFDDYYFHDGMVRGDTLWGGAIYNGVFSAIDVSDKSNPVILGSHSTPNTFSHNCWVSEDGDYVFTTDEVSGAYVAAYDVSDLSDIQEVDRIQAWSSDTDVIPHNTHVDGDFIITSYYKDGVSVVDVSNPSNMIEVGYYDTSVDYSGSGFNGAWGAYPWLPSGNILVSDIETGLYVLEPKYNNACFAEGVVTDAETGYPLSNVSVQLDGSNDPALTALSGFYQTGIAEPGSYELSFSVPGYESQTISVEMLSGVTATTDVSLVPFASYDYNFEVLNSVSLIGVSGATVSIYNDDFDYNLQSDENGLVSISLYPGTYDISIGSWSYQTICEELIVEEQGASQTFTLVKGYQDDFSFDFGWEVTNLFGLSAGAWERGDPNVTYYQSSQINPGFDATGDCGSQAYITGNMDTDDYWVDDVDDGRTRLTSPVFNLTNYENPVLSCKTWFVNTGGNGTPNDSLLIKLTNGVETVLLDYRTVNTSASQWLSHEIALTGTIDLNNQMQLIVETMDGDNTGHLVEAGFDRFEILADNLSLTELDQSLDLFPNPSTDGVFYYSNPSSDSKLRITDLTGKLVYEAVAKNGLNIVNVPTLSAGTYIVELHSNLVRKSSLWIRR